MNQGDFMDGLKAVPIVLIQEIVMKFMYKQKAFSHLLKNSVDAFSAIVVGNIAGRFAGSQIAAVPGATPVYRW